MNPHYAMLFSSVYIPTKTGNELQTLERNVNNSDLLNCKYFQIMGYIWEIVGVFLMIFATATSQDCTSTGFHRGNPACPDGTVEIFREEAFGQTVKLCCIPGTPGENDMNKFARRCRVTRCDQPTANPCSSLYTRIYQGAILEYEEVSRDTCTTVSGGTSAYCCRTNSTEGLLATVYGAERNEFPHMALLNLGGSQCGGTIYNSRCILTAAHCMINSDTTQLMTPDSTWIVKIGRNIGSLEMPENDYGVEQAIPHENYSRMFGNPELLQESPLIYNDIGLLRLNRDIEFGNNPNVKSLQIAPEGFNEAAFSDKAVIVGWGTTDTLDVSDNLQKADFKIRSDESCFAYREESPWPWQFNRTEQLLCVGGILEGVWSPTAGRGDSGGPAICRDANGMGVLCGITSFIRDDILCAERNNEQFCPPSVYVEVDHFRDWIRERAGEQDESSFYQIPLYAEEVPENRVGYHVRVTSDDGKACGGTLVAPDLVVTAAQCVSPGDGSNRMYSGLKVTSGLNNLENSNGITHGIKGVEILEGFERKGDEINLENQGNRIRITDRYHTNDLAVIKLQDGVALQSDQFPQLPEFDERFENPVFELAFPRNTSITRGGQLQQRQFTILDKAECQRRMDRMERVNIQVEVDNNIFCGVEKYSGGSSCDRELGGGLICKGSNGRDTLCGVQIFRLCEWSIPNGFINMAFYKDWVEEVNRRL